MTDCENVGEIIVKFDDSVWDRWLREIEIIKEDLSQAVDDQAVFRHFLNVVNENSDWIETHHGNEFVWFVFSCYVDRAIMQIRRQIKNKDDSHSLVRLLSQMHKCADQITYAYYLKRFPATNPRIDWQRVTFRNFVKRDATGCLSIDDETAISLDLIAEHLGQVDALRQPTEDIADKFIAHIDKKRLPKDIKFDDIKAMIDLLDRLCSQYYCLLTSKGYSTLESVRTSPWQQIFFVPLVEPKPGRP